ncbi:MAG: hypothetical protein Q9172_005237 [Xanthocarpia lactea]
MTSGGFLPGLQVSCSGAGIGAFQNPSVPKPAVTNLPSQQPTSSLTATDRFDNVDPSIGLMELHLRSLGLATTEEAKNPDACTASDCPLRGVVHGKGLFLHDATLGLGVRFHGDFGFSNPPPFIWAAYFRYTQYLKCLGDRGRAVGDLATGSPQVQPSVGHLRPGDASIVLNFLRYHAVTLQQRDGGLVETRLQGEILMGGGPSVIARLDALTI